MGSWMERGRMKWKLGSGVKVFCSHFLGSGMGVALFVAFATKLYSHSFLAASTLTWDSQSGSDEIFFACERKGK